MLHKPGWMSSGIQIIPVALVPKPQRALETCQEAGLRKLRFHLSLTAFILPTTQDPAFPLILANLEDKRYSLLPGIIPRADYLRLPFH
jgi:hypothetical protein